jgi:hypothetical protein
MGARRNRVGVKAAWFSKSRVYPTGVRPSCDYHNYFYWASRSRGGVGLFRRFGGREKFRVPRNNGCSSHRNRHTPRQYRRSPEGNGHALLAIRISLAAGKPTEKASIADAQNVLTAAKKEAIHLPPEVIEQSGTSFVDAAAKGTAAWDAALAFLNYRSSSISVTRITKGVAVPEGAETVYDLGPMVDDKPIPAVTHIPNAVRPEDSARLETIGKNLNEQLKYGSPQLILTGGAVNLDDKYLRHVVLLNVEVHYSGKPIMLEDVVFANCTFVLENTGPSRDLGKTLLASSPVTFAYPS